MVNIIKLVKVNNFVKSLSYELSKLLRLLNLKYMIDYK